MADQGRSEPSRTAPIRRFERSSRSRLVRRKCRRNASARHPRPFTPPDGPVDMEPRAAVASAAIEPYSIVALAALAEAAISDDLDAVAVRECPLQRRVRIGGLGGRSTIVGVPPSAVPNFTKSLTVVARR